MPAKTVREVVEEGVGRDARTAHPLRGGLDAARRAHVGRGDGEAPRRAGAPAGPDRRRQRLGARPAARGRDGGAALPAADAPVAPLSGGERRRVALCRLLLQQPDLLLLDEPTNHLDAESVAWLERHLQEYPGTVVAVTHDRYFLDNVAGWILELDRGAGIPWEGNYSSWLEQKEQRLGAGGEGDVGAAAHAAARARVGAHGAAGAAGEEQGARHQLRAAAGRGPGAGAAPGRGTDHDPARPAPRRSRGRGEGPAQGLRRPPAHRRPRLHAAARRHRRRHRPERRRQDDALPHDHRPGAAGRRHAAHRRHGRARLRRPEPRGARRRRARSGRRSPTAGTKWSWSASAR